MNSHIIVQGNGQRLKVMAQLTGVISEDTLRRAFQLEQDVPVGLFRNDIALECSREHGGFVFHLQNEWLGAEFELRWNEERRSRPVTSMEQGISAIMDTAPKIVIERCRKYMLYSLLTDEAGQVQEGNIKNCVTVASSELAFMARHCLPKSCASGYKFTVYDNAGIPYPVEILYVDRMEQNGDDFAILKITDGKFLHYPSSMSLPENGLPYFILGCDSEYFVDNLSFFNGHFRNTEVFVNRNYVIGSPGTTRGCSGAGVFGYTGSLYGICSSGRLDPTANFMPFYDHLRNLHIRLSEPSYSHIIPAFYMMAKLSPAQKRSLEGGSPEDKKRSKQHEEAPW